MCFLPNAGSLGLGVSSAIIFGLVMLMFLDTSINMAMQPFKMLVGDFVNEEQKSKAYSIQSLLCNAGSVVGYLAPFVLAWFLRETAPEGEVPPTVTWAFYVGSAILLLCVIYTFAKVKEMPPHEYAEYHGLTTNEGKEEKTNILKLLANAPKVFWTVGVVQFFCWAAFLYMWTYSTDAIAGQSFGAPSTTMVSGISVNGENYNDKYVFNGENPVILEGRLSIAGIQVNGEFIQPTKVEIVEGETVIDNSQVVYKNGVALASVTPTNEASFATAGQWLVIDGSDPIYLKEDAKTISEFSRIETGTELTLAHIAKNVDDVFVLEQTQAIPAIQNVADVKLNESTVLNAASKEYQAAGNWNGVLLAIQGLAAVVWAIVLGQFRNRRLGYSLSLLIGAVGFASVSFITNQYVLIASYALMGCAWAAMLSMPFTILTNALSGSHIGTYLGLFNCTICIPQIVAALCGGAILSLFPIAANGAAATVNMLTVSGILLFLGAIAVWIIKETLGSQKS